MARTQTASKIKNFMTLNLVGGLFILAGLTLLFMQGMELRQEVRTYTAYQTGLCKIESKEIRELHDEEDHTDYKYDPVFVFQVRTDEGKTLATARGYDGSSRSFFPPVLSSSNSSKATAILSRFELEETYSCWYDPEAPWEAVLVRRISWGILGFMLFPLLVMALGGWLMRLGFQSLRTRRPKTESGSIT